MEPGSGLQLEDSKAWEVGKGTTGQETEITEFRDQNQGPTPSQQSRGASLGFTVTGFHLPDPAQPSHFTNEHIWAQR